MRFQQRDAVILKTIYENEGVISKRHIKSLFWRDKEERTMQIRLAKLHNAGYIDWPTLAQRRNYPIPEPICWLGWKGALFIASARGMDIQQPNVPKEVQLRRIQKKLREKGIRWVRQPRWSLLRHDIAVMDVKLAVMEVVGASTKFTLERWIPESVFRAKMDKVDVEFVGKDGKKRLKHKGVCPDAYFEVIDETRRLRGEPARARFLL